MYSESYCDVCRLGPVEPGYNPREYDETINKAIRKAKNAILQSSGGYFHGKAITEGQKNWEDLRQLVDLEIWVSRRHHGSKWSEALCYTIARHTAGAYLGELVKEKYILVEDADGSPVLDESGKQVRIYRFISFDVEEKNEEGEASGTSVAEKEIARPDRQPDLVEVVKDHKPALEKLVAGWRGNLRAVGEAILAGTFSARGVPGIPKSTASRLYQTATTAFRAHLKTKC